MNKKFIGLAFSIAVLVSGASAQTVTGSGTSGTVPVFTGSSTIGNSSSPIVVSSGNVGIGTTAPANLLDVEISQDVTNGRLGVFKVGNLYSSLGGDGQTESNGYTFYMGSQPFVPLLYKSLSLSGGSNGSNLAFVDSAGNGAANITFGSVVAYGHNITVEALASQTPDVFDVLNASSGTLLNVQPGGNVGVGTTSPGAKLEVDGNVKLTSGSGGSITFQDGTTQSTAYTGVTCGGDYAESVDVSGNRGNYEAGDLLVIDPDHPGKFLKSAEPYSTSVTGIYSTKPGTVGRRQTTPKSPDEVPMAMVGIVPAKVSAENGAIRPGDLLVSSSTFGFAMKGSDRSKMLGAVIGKALGSLDSGLGVIEVVVTLQ